MHASEGYEFTDWKVQNYNNKILISSPSFKIETNVKINLNGEKDKSNVKPKGEEIMQTKPNIESNKERKQDVKPNIEFNISYPSQLTVEKANTSDDLANYLDLTFIIESNNRLYTKL